MMSEASVIKGIRMEGELVLQSPLRIGSGESDGIVDLQVLKDKNGRAFIPATSLAGVLREAASAIDPETARLLFGDSAREQENESRRSALYLDDVMLDNARITERDGVGIDAVTGVAVKTQKYDYEAVDRGAAGHFQARVKLRRCDEARWEEIKALLAFLARRLQRGLSVGSLTSKGFGRIQAAKLAVHEYDFQEWQYVKGWLRREPGRIWTLEEAAEEAPQDFVVEGTFALRGALIVRKRQAAVWQAFAGDAAKEKNPDVMVQMTSGGDFVIPGTTLKGVLRRRAARILQKIGADDAAAQEWLEELMGCSRGKKRQKSRLMVEEAYFKAGVVEGEQTRTRVDRFTGGVADGALFVSRPVWQEDAAEVLTLRFAVRCCTAWEAGLMLFLLRDLWTGALPVGGEKAVGRGRLAGRQLKLRYQGQEYGIGAPDGFAIAGDRDKLEDYARKLRRKAGEQ